MKKLIGPIKKINKESFVFRVLSLLSSNLVYSGSLFLIGIFTARILGPAGRGYYSLFFTSVSLISSVCGLGLSQANLYFTNQDKSLFSRLLGNTVLMTFLVFLAICAGLGIMVNLFDFATHTVISDMTVILVSIASFMYLLEVNLGGLGYGLHLYAFQSKSIKINSVLLCLSALLIIPFGADPQAAVMLRLSFLAMFLIWYVYNFSKYIPTTTIDISWSVLKQQIHFGARNWMQNLIGLLNSRGNIFVLAAISGNESLGVYSVALLFAECIKILPDTVGTLLLPKLVSKNTALSPEDITAKLLRTTLAGISLGSMLLMLSVSYIIPALLGSVYRQSVICALIIIPGAAIGCIFQIFTRYFTSQYKQIYSIRAALAGLFATILSTLLLAPKYGAAGAASGYTIASCATSFILLNSFSSYSKIPAIDLLIPKPDDFHSMLKIFQRV